jgi:hypothetical protein
MTKLREIVNTFLESIGKKHLVFLSFEKKNVELSWFNLKQVETVITYLNNNLISAYEDWDILSAKRIRSMLIERVTVRDGLMKKINDDLAGK